MSAGTGRAFRGRRVIAHEDGEARVLDGGFVVVAGGTITAVGGASAAKGLPCEDLGDVVIAPGLVNAHAHLELSAAPFQERPSPFSSFLWAMRDYRRGATEAELAAAAAAGARQCLATGTTAIADLVTSAAAARAVARSGIGGAILVEVVGLDPLRAGDVAAGIDPVLAAAPPLLGGVFLHAPYSVSSELRALVLAMARRKGVPCATHLLESPDEVALLTAGTGPMADEIRRMGLGDRLPLPRPLPAIVEEHGSGELSLVHLASLPEALAGGLAAGTGVVLCPRSNANLGVGPAPFAALRAVGASVALGTDSLASCPSLDMRAEIRAACDGYGIAPEEGLRLGTRAPFLVGGGRGQVAPGFRADLVAVEDGLAGDAHEAFLDATASVASVLVGGRRMPATA